MQYNEAHAGMLSITDYFKYELVIQISLFSLCAQSCLRSLWFVCKEEKNTKFEKGT